jgi:putative nucleotidyltransferase with HDIG domain
MSIREGMSSAISVLRAHCEKLDRSRIDCLLSGCASLPSLGAIDSTLRELLGADQGYTSQIAEVIRRDPSLTTRLLRLVNAVYYGKSKPARNIDEAVFYVGVRQIRQLAMVTQIIEDFQKLADGHLFPWRQFWRHCIATALMTREITQMLRSQDEEIDYVAGLIHDVGKIVMASAFAGHFYEIYHFRAEEGGDLMELEREVLGVDHADLGAMYLRKHRLPDVYVDIVQFHHSPQLARSQSRVAAAVQLADWLVRQAKIGNSGNRAEASFESCLESPGWKALFGRQTESELGQLRESFQRSLESISPVLETLV